MTKFNYTYKYTYPKFLADQPYFAKVFKVRYEQKTYFFTLFTSLVTLLFSQIQFFFDLSMSSFLLRFVEGIMTQNSINKSNVLN